MQLRNKILAAALISSLPFAAHAESNYVTTGNAAAHLDFQIVIPRVLYLRVGTGTNFANNTNIDLVSFTVPAANVGDGTVISATSGGDVSPGVVTAKVIGNSGNVTLNATTVGALNNGTAAQTISWTQISTTSSVPATLPAPALTDGGTGTNVALTAANNVVNQSATWTYKYTNTVVPAQGTYGGAGANNGRVTYTASAP